MTEDTLEQLNELAYYCVTRHPADARVLFSEARKADELGLGSCMIGERLTVKEAGVLAGGIAGCSPTLGVASAATNHHTRHPMVTASIGSTMQALTEGRYAMAFGRGAPAYWEAIGLPKVTEARLRDFVGILRTLWSGEMIVDHDGPAGRWPVLFHHSNLEEHPPIGFVAVGPKTMELAGEIGDFVIMHTFFNEQATTDSIAAVRRGAERAGKDPDSVRIWSCLATIADGLPEEDRLRRTTGRLITYMQAYGDVLTRVNGWDPADWERIAASEVYQDAAAAGAIDATASVETLERLRDLMPASWLDATATGSGLECARTVVREIELGCHSVIMHGASPHELVDVVEAYRTIRPALTRPVAVNPGWFA